MKITAIVPAAGRGSRLKAKVEKAFILLDKKPVLFYTLKNLEKIEEIQEIILVVSKRSLKYTKDKFLRKFRFKKVKKIVKGGARRTESVWNGLKAVGADSEWVLIHDGVRPLIAQALINKVIKAGERYGAAALGIPINATIKKIKNFRVAETVERKFLWEIQTPQIFLKDILFSCYQKARREKFTPTDDAQIVERYGHTVKVVEGSPLNIKITTPEDLVLAKAILRSKMSYIY
jgi:2-C-methyl-D-erythritol 4-phosphate cytidylyltransferase